MTNKIKYLSLAAGLSLAGLLASVGSVFAAPSSTPEEIIDTVAGGTIDEGVDLLTYIIQNYLAYILALGVCVALYFIFKRFARIGSR